METSYLEKLENAATPAAPQPDLTVTGPLDDRSYQTLDESTSQMIPRAA